MTGALLEPRASKIIGDWRVEWRAGDFLRLQELGEPFNIHSEWDFARQRAQCYAGIMADLARNALDGRKGPQHVLMLGLGGGTIAADMICGAGKPLDLRLHITAVEADADIAIAARKYFFPLMFQQNPNAEEQLHILLANAMELVSGAAVLTEDTMKSQRFDVTALVANVDEEPQ